MRRSSRPGSNRAIPASGSDRPERRLSLPFDLFALSSRVGAYLDRALDGTGLKPVEYAIYSLMLEAGPRTPSELAAALGVPPSTMSGYLRPMLERGDARRLPNPADGRSFRVELTEQGLQAQRRVEPAFSVADLAILARLDRPPDEVRATLAAIADAIERAAADLETTSTDSSNS
jgi:DNA-binding MarR family transcriptional regulator